MVLVLGLARTCIRWLFILLGTLLRGDRGLPCSRSEDFLDSFFTLPEVQISLLFVDLPDLVFVQKRSIVIDPLWILTHQVPIQALVLSDLLERLKGHVEVNIRS